jgi:hypothetical protein
VISRYRGYFGTKSKVMCNNEKSSKKNIPSGMSDNIKKQ